MLAIDHRDDGVAVLRMQAEPNLLNRPFLTELLAAVVTVRDDEQVRLLVTTGAGRAYSTGLDLEGLQGGDDDDRVATAQLLHDVCRELLILPVPTVAAINGHAFAGGAMIALAHDLRVQRSDRGYFCLSEALVGVPPTPGFMALVRAKLGPVVAEDLLLTGRRLAADEAVALGVAAAQAPEAEVVDRAIALGIERCGPSRTTLTTIKQRLHIDVVAGLLEGGRLL